MFYCPTSCLANDYKALGRRGALSLPAGRLRGSWLEGNSGVFVVVAVALGFGEGSEVQQLQRGLGFPGLAVQVHGFELRVWRVEGLGLGM